MARRGLHPSLFNCLVRTAPTVWREADDEQKKKTSSPREVFRARERRLLSGFTPNGPYLRVSFGTTGILITRTRTPFLTF